MDPRAFDPKIEVGRPNPKFEYNIRTFGIRRSGNHFVISSILLHFDDGSVHWFNNPPTPNLSKYFGSRLYHPRLTSTDDVPSITLRRKLRNDNPFTQDYNNTNASLVETYEDKDLSTFYPRIPKRCAAKTFNVLIIRDIFNIYASRLFCSWRSKRYDLTGVSEHLKEQWKEYAREFLGETHILDNKVAVNYNKLVHRDDVHIQDVKSKLEGHFILSDRSSMTNFGFGTSFPKEDVNVCERYRKLPYPHLNTLQRWWTEDSEFRRLHLLLFDFEPQFQKFIQFHVINLERRPNRWKIFQDRASRIGLTEYIRFNAVDGSKLKIDDPRLSIFKENTFNSRRGIIGSSLSHMRLWKDLTESEYKYYLIFEDDIRFSETFMKYLNYLLQQLTLKELPLVFLGLNYPEFDWSKVFPSPKEFNTDTDETLGKRKLEIYLIPPVHAKKVWGGTFGYIISKQRAQQMLSDINTNGLKTPEDTFILSYPDIYMTYPRISHAYIVMGSPNDPDSDIQSDHIPVGEKYTFYQGLDYIGGDIQHIGNRSIKQ